MKRDKRREYQNPPIIQIRGTKLTAQDAEKLAQKFAESMKHGRTLIMATGPEVTITPIYPISPKRARFLRGH